MKIRIKKTRETAVVPAYATEGSAAFDLVAATDGSPHKNDDNAWVFPTGLAFEIPDNHVMLIFSRSGHGFKEAVRLSNCVGVIDSDYRGEVAVSLRADGDRQLGDALLDQRLVAGLGNVYKSELCFMTGLHPLLPIGAVPEETLRKVLELGRRLLRANAYAPSPAAEAVTFTGLRRTTAAMDPRRRLWVYGRAGLPCRRCGSPIGEKRQGLGARVTFFCPTCQPLKEATTA